MNNKDIENLFTSEKKDFFKVARDNKVSIKKLKKYIFDSGFKSYKGGDIYFLEDLKEYDINKHLDKSRIKDFTVVEATNKQIITTIKDVYFACTDSNLKKRVIDLKQEKKTVREISKHLALNIRSIYDLFNNTTKKHSLKKKKNLTTEEKNTLVWSKRQSEINKINDFEKTYFPGRVITEKTRFLLQKYGKLEKYENKKASF